MTTNARKGLGTKVYWFDDPTWTLIGECRNVDMSPSADIADATSFDSTWREKIGTIKDAGDLTMEFVLDPGASLWFGASKIISNLGGTEQQFAVEPPSASTETIVVAGIVQAYSVKAAFDGIYEGSLTIALSSILHNQDEVGGA